MPSILGLVVGAGVGVVWLVVLAGHPAASLVVVLGGSSGSLAVLGYLVQLVPNSGFLLQFWGIFDTLGKISSAWSEGLAMLCGAAGCTHVLGGVILMFGLRWGDGMCSAWSGVVAVLCGDAGCSRVWVAGYSLWG